MFFKDVANVNALAALRLTLVSIQKIKRLHVRYSSDVSVGTRPVEESEMSTISRAGQVPKVLCVYMQVRDVETRSVTRWNCQSCTSDTLITVLPPADALPTVDGEITYSIQLQYYSPFQGWWIVFDNLPTSTTYYPSHLNLVHTWEYLSLVVTLVAICQVFCKVGGQCAARVTLYCKITCSQTGNTYRTLRVTMDKA